jgi:hypothetical protein
MKTILFIFMFGFLTGFSPVRENSITLYPIPSSNVEVDGFANFRETTTPNSMAIPEGKRYINVIVTSSYPHGNAQATVWFYSLDSLEMIGPYSVSESNELTEEIDFNAWGALVETDEEILVTVWIGDSSQPPSYKRNSKNNGRLH